MALGEKERLALRMDREIGLQMDEIIEKVTALAGKYGLGEEKDSDKDSEKKSPNSPLTNVLNVSVEPSSSLEVIKGFIRYQTGRKGGEQSNIWKIKDFANALVTDIDGLSQDVDSIVARIELSEEEAAKEREESSQSSLSQYISAHRVAIRRSLHLQLTQLYLGYLRREHIARKGGFLPGKKKKLITRERR